MICPRTEKWQTNSTTSVFLISSRLIDNYFHMTDWTVRCIKHKRVMKLFFQFWDGVSWFAGAVEAFAHAFDEPRLKIPTSVVVTAACFSVWLRCHSHVSLRWLVLCLLACVLIGCSALSSLSHRSKWTVVVWLGSRKAVLLRKSSRKKCNIV